MSSQEPVMFRKYMLDIKDYKIDRQVQSGGFGSVFTVQKLETNDIFAAKVINMQKDESQYKRMFSREIGIMIRCQHPTIIRFYGYTLKDFNMQNNVTIFMEFAKKGSLADFLEKIQKGLSDDNVNNTVRQIILVGIARGMMFLHQHKIIHRDLKPGNILLDDELHPRITDFGLSKLIDNFSQSQSQQCGTCKYMAPEVIEGTHYNGKADVYSFGILMYEVVTDSDPYPLLTKNKLTAFKFNQKVVNDNYRPTFSVPIKKSIKKLIERCWSKNPAERPTFEELFKKLAYGTGDSIEDIYEEQKILDEEEEDNDESDNNYYLEDVDIDEVVFYADDIDNNADNASNIDLSSIKELINNEISPLRNENQHLKEQIKKLEKKLNDQEKSYKSAIDKQTKEIKKLKKDIENQKQESVTANDKLKKDIENQKQESVTANDKLKKDIENQIQSFSKPNSVPSKKDTKNKSGLKFLKNDDTELNGLINYYMRQAANEIEITASSFDGSSVEPSNVSIHHNSQKCFCSKNIENSWLCFEFKKNNIIPTDYTIRVGNWGSQNDYPKSWVIEGSTEGSGWYELDNQENCPYLNGPNNIYTFSIENSKEVKFLRIRETGLSWNNSFYLQIESFEIYGTIK